MSSFYKTSGKQGFYKKIKAKIVIFAYNIIDDVDKQVKIKANEDKISLNDM